MVTMRIFLIFITLKHSSQGRHTSRFHVPMAVFVQYIRLFILFKYRSLELPGFRIMYHHHWRSPVGDRGSAISQYHWQYSTVLICLRFWQKAVADLFSVQYPISWCQFVFQIPPWSWTFSGSVLICCLLNSLFSLQMSSTVEWTDEITGWTK